MVKFGISGIGLLSLFLLLTACSRAVNDYSFRQNYSTAEEIVSGQGGPESLALLKVHMKNGEVHVLEEEWFVDQESGLLIGSSKQYDVQRRFVDYSNIELELDSIAIYETNLSIKDEEEKGVWILKILTAIDLIFIVQSLLN